MAERREPLHQRVNDKNDNRYRGQLEYEITYEISRDEVEDQARGGDTESGEEPYFARGRPPALRPRFEPVYFRVDYGVRGERGSRSPRARQYYQDDQMELGDASPGQESARKN